MNNFRIAVFALALLVPCSGFSQSHEGKAGAIRAFQPGMTWRVEALPESERILAREKFPVRPAHVKGRIAEENVILKDGFRRQTTFLENGEKLTRYIRGNLIILENKGEFSIEAPDPDATIPSSKGFGEFFWIAPEWKVGTVTLDGVDCDIFARPWPIDTPAGSAPATHGGDSLQAYAAIGRQEGFPHRLETPLTVQRYVFSVTNPIPELPNGAILALRRADEAAKEMIRRYAIPQ